MSKHLSIVTRAFLYPLILFVAGCASQHSVRVHDDSLTFSYRAPEARDVYFCSSADNFQYHRATRKGKSPWQVTVPMQKEFSYFYIVDGVVTLPECPATSTDDFGTTNCLYEHGM